MQGQNCELTNSNGEYTIPNLPFGNYKIEFWPRAYVRWVFEYYDDTRHWSQAQWIDVNGPVTGIDSDLTIGGEFIGHVTRASDGEPLSEVLICAEEPLQEFTECTESWGDQGVYQLASLIEGDYLVEFLPAEGQGVRAQFYNGKSELSEADLVHVTAEAQTTEIDAALPAEATITGLVTDASTRSGLGEIEVCAFELAGSEITGCEFTEPSGSYVITDLPTGAYKVGFFSESEEEEEEEEEELLGSSPFPVEFWNDQPRWETADILTLGLGVRGGIDAALGSPPSGSPPSTPAMAQASTFPSVPKPKVRRARCRSGKRWKKVRGKKRCVKVHKRAHRKRSGNWKPPHYLERQLRHCGVVTSGGFSARVTVFKVPCGKARRIVESYMRQGRPPTPVKIKGFPAWKCSSGSGLGTCRWHDKLGSRAPEIVFAWVP